MSSKKTSASAPHKPRVFLLDADYLLAAKTRLQNGDETLAPALAELERDAREHLAEGPFSVVDKDATPPSGDKHDYMSRAPYWWPNPDTPDGLPYIRRDGERNPEIYEITDRRGLGKMGQAVETLALACFFTEKEIYAEKSAELLRVWFLNPGTRMNPHFQYAQAIPGITDGRGIGLIETVGLTEVVDAIGLLAGSKAWTNKDQRAMREWFSQFLHWMLESEHGKDEAAAENNHGTYYDLQVASFALFVGKPDLAKSVLEQAREKRFARQISPDGRQLEELDRTKAWSYSVMNLRGLMSLARLGEHVGVDLWHFETADGRGIRAALDFLLPYALDHKEWPYPEIGGMSARSLNPLIRLAAAKYPEERYPELLTRISQPSNESRSRLTRPEVFLQNQSLEE